MNKPAIQLFFLLILLSPLLIGQTYHVAEDFNTSSLPVGWTNTAISGTQTWSFGVDGSIVNAGNNNLNGTAMAFFDDDALGASSLDNTIELITPIFDNSSSATTTLSFEYNFRQFASPLDSFAVAVFDGISWVTVFSRSIDDCGRWDGLLCSNNYPTAAVDITSYANANCQVKFIYHDGNDWCWYIGIDNVVISSPVPNDIGVTAISSPTSNCGLSSSEPIQVTIKNFGLSTTSAPFDVTLDINNGAQILSETVTTNIPAGDSLLYNFAATANLQTTGVYHLATYTNYPLDSVSRNDTQYVSVTSRIFNTLPFYDSLEGVNNWMIEGINPSWALGTPNNSYIDSAASGVNAFVTNLSGNYNPNEESYLITPCFDFSMGIGAPILSFDLIYFTESLYDSLILEATTDNGISWNKVNAGQLSSNWYTNNSSWQGFSGGWLSVENSLDSLVGFGGVRFRFKFKSDASAQREGVGIDNFRIEFPQANDLVLKSVVYPLNTGNQLCGLGIQNIILEVNNRGLNQVDTTFLSYQVNNGSIVHDTLITPIAPSQSLNYTFTTPYNFSAIGNYSINTWIDIPRNSFTGNDSILNYVVSNNQTVNASPAPFVEDFEGSDWIAQGALGVGWSRTPNSLFGYVWNVATTVPGNITGPNRGRNGFGKFLHVTSSGFGGSSQAILESPCIDLTTIRKGVTLEYWHHSFGQNVVPIRLDVYDGIQWINDIDVNGTANQTSSLDPWDRRVVYLDQFAGRTIKIRFRTAKLAASGGGDVAIDDISIFETPLYDVQTIRLDNPVSGCNPSDSISVVIENSGFLAVSNIPISYQINNGNIVNEFFTGTLLPQENVTFTFQQTSSFNLTGAYQIDVWTDLAVDSTSFNDSLNTILLNTTQASYFKEDFENAVDGSCTNSSTANVNDILPLWQEESTTSYQWHVHDILFCGGGTQSANTGPNQDHTRGDGKYLFTEASGANGVAQLVSTCLDFSTDTNLVLDFWYHKFGSDATDLFVDVYSNGAWVNGLDTILGQTHNSSSAPWLKRSVDLNVFSGQLIQVRFRTSSLNSGFASDIAIDDIEIYPKSTQDIKLSEIISPQSSCFLTNSETVSVTISNFGTQDILPGALTMSYTLNSGTPINQVFQDTLRVDSTTTFTFNQRVNLSSSLSIHDLFIYGTLAGDNTPQTNQLEDEIDNLSTSVNYTQDFENINNSVCHGFAFNEISILPFAWGSNSNNWFVQNGNTCFTDSIRGATNTANTGPISAHEGESFLYYESYGNNLFNRTVQLPCIDLANFPSANLDFWYHKYGANMGDLFIEVIDTSGQVIVIDSILGQTHFANTDPWSNKIVNLNGFIGQQITIQLKVDPNSLSSSSGNIAIDFLRIYNPLTVNLSNPSGIPDNTYTLFPNPNTGSFTLKANQQSIGRTYTVLNLKGQEVQIGTIQNENEEIQLQNRERGVYFLRINESGETLKFVVM